MANWLQHRSVEVATIAYVALIAFIARATGLTFLLFPGLAAIAYDVLERPDGAWAKTPIWIVATPFLTGIIGTFVTRLLPYGPLSVLLSVGGAILAMQLLGSQVTPAIAAALLPVTIDLSSWFYPPGLLVGTVVLVLVLLGWKRLVRSVPTSMPLLRPGAAESEDVRSSLAAYLFFLAAGAAFIDFTGWRFVLCPPLAVAAFEMFRHPLRCPWAGRPFALPLAFTCSAIGGVFLAHAFGLGPLGAACSVALGIAILRSFDLYAPPALAVGLLPFIIIPHPRYRFAVEVGVGTLFVTLMFTAWRSSMNAGMTRVTAARHRFQ